MEEYATQDSRKFRKVSIIIQKKTKRPVSTGRLINKSDYLIATFVKMICSYFLYLLVGSSIYFSSIKKC